MPTNGQLLYDNYNEHRRSTWDFPGGGRPSWANQDGAHQNAWENLARQGLALINPAIAIMIGGVTLIADGDVTPTVAKGTDFGSSASPTPVDKQYVFINCGSSPLVIASVTPPAGYTIQVSPVGTIQPGQIFAWTLRCTKASAGTFTGTVSIVSNDAGTPYTFNVTGIAT